MHVHHLTSVDGEIVFDVDPDTVTPAAAGVRLADGLTVDDGARLARLWTTMYASFEIRAVGASVGVRPRLLQPRADTVAALVAELQELVDDGRIDVVADFGISQEDLPAAAAAGSGLADVGSPPRLVGGALRTRAAGVGVASAAQAWLGSVDGATVAIEGFGATGEAVAREMTGRGARVVALSTERGAIASAAGFDLDEMAASRDQHGPGFVHETGHEVHRPREMHELPVDVLVPGPAFGIVDGDVAAAVQSRVVVPSGLGCYTDSGRATLRHRRVAALPDTVTAAGSILAGHAPIGLSDDEILSRVERLVAERIDGARLAKIDPTAYVTTLADTFATTWLSRHG